MNQAGSLKVATPGEREIAMTRVFNAPRQLVFKALTTPELLKRWLHGPDGWELVECQVDLRVGGVYRYLWRSTEGAEMGMGGTSREIVAPERIVTTELFDQGWTGGETLTPACSPSRAAAPPWSTPCAMPRSRRVTAR